MYRIVKIKHWEDTFYRIQIRFLWFLWWINYYIETWFWWVSLQFTTLEEAKKWIDNQSNPDKDEILWYY